MAKPRVGIVGVGVSEFRIHEEPFYNVAFSAAKKAMDDAAVERREIDSFILGGYDNLGVGRTISNMYTAPAAGGYLKHEIRVSDDAAFALPLAYMRIKAGLSDVAILLAFGMTSEIPLELVEIQSLDPFFHREIKLAPQMAYAMRSYVYRRKYGVKDEELAEVVVRDRENASKNPLAYVREKVSVDDVLNSDMAVYPLRRLEMAEWCDGCVAFILAEETIARRINPEPVWIKGVGWSIDNYFLGARELDKFVSVRDAANRAFKMAGVERREVDVAEIMDLTSDSHPMILEALGFAEYGKGVDVLNASNLKVNESGGAMCTNAYGSTGAFLLANVVEALREGEAETGLAQAMSGFAGQNAVVSILGV